MFTGVVVATVLDSTAFLDTAGLSFTSSEKMLNPPVFLLLVDGLALLVEVLLDLAVGTSRALVGLMA